MLLYCRDLNFCRAYMNSFRSFAIVSGLFLIPTSALAVNNPAILGMNG